MARKTADIDIVSRYQKRLPGEDGTFNERLILNMWKRDVSPTRVPLEMVQQAIKRLNGKAN